jgi:hypothetical protein
VATDTSGNAASGSFTVTVADTTAPVIVLTSPANGAMYLQHEPVVAAYECLDAVGVANCAGTLPGAAIVDTSVRGVFRFEVTATDAAGNTFADFAEYTVFAPPEIQVQSPVEPIYELESVVVAEYVCLYAVECSSLVASGAPIDTSTSGRKSFNIAATDALGNETIQSVNYAVSTGTTLEPLAGLTAWLGGDGYLWGTHEEVTEANATWSGTPTYAAGKVLEGFAVGNANTVAFPLVQTGPFTVQAWLRTADSLQPEFSGVLSAGTTANADTTWQIELDGTGNYRLQVGNGALSIPIGPASPFFQHVAVTFDGAIVSVYLNGELAGSEPWTGSPDLGIAGLTIGLDRTGLYPYSGVADEVQVFSRALDAGEVEQSFLAGASGMRKDRPPVAVATATPNPAEATSPNGATVTLDATGSSDPDLDPLTYEWREGETVLSTDAVLPVLFPIGTHSITLTVYDGHARFSSTSLDVIVRDTTGPVAQTTLPSVDAMLTGPTAEVVVSASDVVGVTAVSVNGVAAALTAGTMHSGTWRATVPIVVPVALGGVLRFDIVATDAAGNPGYDTRFVDVDGIPASMDKTRDAGLDQSDFFSNEFNNGTTSGRIIRNGWTTLLSPAAGGAVRARVTGSGTVARLAACAGTFKEVWLDAVGETADITCLGQTVNVRAVSTLGTILVLKQMPNNLWTAAQLRAGGYSAGSPATASDTNTEPIDVQVLQGASVEQARVVGTFRLAPGDSVDVAVVPAARGSDPQLRLTALRGTVAVMMRGAAGELVPGLPSTWAIDQTPPRVRCAPADRRWHNDNVRLACTAEDALSGLAVGADARFTLATSVAEEAETPDAATETREVCDAAGNCVTAGAVGGNQIDRRAPDITVSGPVQGQTYLLNQAVQASFHCIDAGAGVSACDGTTLPGQSIPTETVGPATFAVTASDAVGNTRTTSTPYVVTHAIVPLEDGPVMGTRGQPLPIQLRIADARQVNRSAATITLTAHGVVADATGAQYELDAAFGFDAAKQAYTLTLDTADLDAGAYTLAFTVSGDPVEHTVAFHMK